MIYWLYYVLMLDEEQLIFVSNFRVALQLLEQIASLKISLKGYLQETSM